MSVRVRVSVSVSVSGFDGVGWGEKGGGGGGGGEWREVKNGGWVGRRVWVEGWGWGVFGESDGFRISCKGKSTE